MIKINDLDHLVLYTGIVLFIGGNFLPYLGNLPGNFLIETSSIKLYFPLTSSLIFSVLVYLLFKLTFYFRLFARQ